MLGLDQALLSELNTACRVGQDAFWLRTSEDFAWIVPVTIAGIHLSEQLMQGDVVKHNYLIVQVKSTTSLQHIMFEKVDYSVFMNTEDAKECAEHRGFKFIGGS